MGKSVESVKKALDQELGGTPFVKLLKWHDPVWEGDADGISVRVRTPTSRGFDALRFDQAASAAVMSVAHKHGYKMG